MSSRLLAGRYELIEKIGEGGMAIVYKGKDRLLNRFVAIKILRPEFTKDEQFIQNFIKESQSAAGLTHPNIVGVYDVGQEGNIHYIVMELLEGKVLSDLIREKGKLDYKEAISIVIQVARALSLAHKNQIVHRDVKPHNIVITDNGTAKLADFGIAKAVSAATIVGGNQKILGSVHYFSPEQARGSYVDERSDIYSLGIVLYEMLTGHVPFDGDNPVSIALMHINDPMPKLSDELSSIPPQLEKIVLKATEKYQSNRYKNVDQMIEDLESLEFITNVMGKKVVPTSFTQEMDRIIPEKEKSEKNERGERESHSKSEHRTSKPRKERTKSASKSESIVTKIEDKIEAVDGNEKIKKGSTVFIAVAAGILLVLAIVIFGFIFGWFGKSEEIAVPNLVGLTYEQAEASATDLGLQVIRGEDVYSPDQEEGYISSQDPAPDKKLSEGNVITVYVSKGKRAGVMPSIEGKSVEEAEAILTEFGFGIGITDTTASSEKAGTIVYQSIKAGSPVPAGTKVDIKVSDGKGKKTVQVPNLIGMTAEEAQLWIEDAKLKVGEISIEETDKANPNTVFWQSGDPMSSVDEGTVIDIKVAKGEKPEGAGNGEDVVIGADETDPEGQEGREASQEQTGETPAE